MPHLYDPRLNMQQADLSNEVGLCLSPSRNKATTVSTIRFPFPKLYLVRLIILVGHHVYMCPAHVLERVYAGSPRARAAPVERLKVWFCVGLA